MHAGCSKPSEFPAEAPEETYINEKASTSAADRMSTAGIAPRGSWMSAARLRIASTPPRGPMSRRSKQVTAAYMKRVAPPAEGSLLWLTPLGVPLHEYATYTVRTATVR